MMRRMNENEFIDMIATLTGVSPAEVAREMGFRPAPAPVTPVTPKKEHHECSGNCGGSCSGNCGGDCKGEHKHPENVMQFDSLEDFLSTIFGGVNPVQTAKANEATANNGCCDETEESEQDNAPTEIKEHYAPIRINCRKTNGNTVVEFELAGFTTKDISVVLEGDAVTVTAVRKVDRQAMSICEIDDAKQRTVVIGNGYTVEDFQHSFKNGILTLTFPSQKKNESGRIQIL